MLTIGKLGIGRGRLEYYDAQVAAGAEDYYAGRGESPGRWRGRGAAALGLGEGKRVARSAFMALMQGRNPVDDTLLRAIGSRSTVAGLDLTFSAPKSVSVLFAIADEQTSGALLQSHERALDAALAYLEREACWTRRGRGGAERVRGDGFIAASYRHRMSRAGDPQLHTHVVVANMTRAAGRYTALEAHSIYEHKSPAGALYRAVLRAEVRERLPWVLWREVSRGLFEVEGIPDDVLRHFSQRRVEIEERAVELAGVDAGELSRERMEGIALATRRAKSYAVEGSGWREQARARAAEHGFGHAELAALRDCEVAGVDQPDPERLAIWLSGPGGLTERHNTFARRHAVAEIAGAFAQGASPSQLEQATTGYLEDRSVRPLGSGGQSELRYTTEGLLACEREIIEGALRRGLERTAVLCAELVDCVLARTQPALNQDQTAAVRAITTGGRGIESVTALAGTGKTTMIGALAACYEQAGWRVLGAAPTGRGARELRSVAQIPARTMHSLLSELEASGGLARRTVLVLDEAGMAPTRRCAELFAHAERAGAKVIAVGDAGQLRSVQAGGWLAALTRQQPGPVLGEVMRQRDPEERAALAALHDGEPERYLEHKQEQLTLTMHASEADAISELSDAWDAAQRQHGRAGVVMIARENYTREQLNRAARAKLRRAGVLACQGVLIGAREYAAGDRVIARRNDRGRDVDNGTLATVVKIDRGTGSMILQTDAEGPRELDPGYVAEHVEHAYALTAHGAQGATVTWAGVIGRPEEFSREWAYTALSRAREQTTLHVIGERSERERERDQYAPADAERDSVQTLRALHQAMKRSEVEVLALEQIETHDELANPLSAELAGGDASASSTPAVSIADADTRQLQTELTEPKRQAAMSTSQRAAPDALDRQFEAVVARQRVLRTELAERREAHIVRALADPPEHLIAALGPPPENPIARCRWSVRARQIEALHFESAKPPPSTPAPIRGPAPRAGMPSADIRAPTLGR